MSREVRVWRVVRCRSLEFRLCEVWCCPSELAAEPDDGIFSQEGTPLPVVSL